MQFLRIFFLYILLLMPLTSFSGEWKFRAREHISESHKITIDGVESRYSGFSNTLNFWYENPFDYSIGLAVGPLLANIKPSSSVVPGNIGQKLDLFTVGIEFKYFPFKEKYKVFSRLGLSGTRLKTEGTLPNSDGWNGYVGLGWEFLYKGIGIATEIGYRKTELGNNVSISSVIPSIGIHFY